MNKIEKGDTVKIARVEIKAGYAKDFIQFIANNIDAGMTVTQVRSNGTRPIVVYSDGVHEEFSHDELLKV